MVFIPGVEATLFRRHGGEMAAAGQRLLHGRRRRHQREAGHGVFRSQPLPGDNSVSVATGVTENRDPALGDGAHGDTQGMKKNRFPLHPKTLYGAALLCDRQSWIIHQYQRLGGCPGLWRTA